MYDGSIVDEDPIDLGECCGCGCTGESVHNIVALNYRAPTPGTGWGCTICLLLADGAIAVICDECLEKFKNGDDILKKAISGYALRKGRCDIKTLNESFRHLDILHQSLN